MVKRFASDNNLIVLGAGCYEDWYDLSIMDISPFTWARLFDRAKYVITGTFHGVIFAIKARKQFVAFPTMVNRVEKIRSLLNLIGLEDRLIYYINKYDLCNCLDSIIDYEETIKVIDELKYKSIWFLKDCIL